MKKNDDSITACYITPEGGKALREELTWLWKVERPRVTQGVADAAAEGDRSENAEYIYGKKRLREIDRRVRFLVNRLDALTIVDEPPADRQRIFFGAWVRLENEHGEESVYRIVGPDELDPSKGYISMDSPVAKALLGRREGDDLVVQRPAGPMEYTVLEISYEELHV